MNGKRTGEWEEGTLDESQGEHKIESISSLSPSANRIRITIRLLLETPSVCQGSWQRTSVCEASSALVNAHPASSFE